MRARTSIRFLLIIQLILSFRSIEFTTLFFIWNANKLDRMLKSWPLPINFNNSIYVSTLTKGCESKLLRYFTWNEIKKNSYERVLWYAKRQTQKTSEEMFFTCTRKRIATAINPCTHFVYKIKISEEEEKKVGEKLFGICVFILRKPYPTLL